MLSIKDVQLLKVKVNLAEENVRLKERDKQLADVKEQLQEWVETANKLINCGADFEEWKKEVQQRMSAANSMVPSPKQSPTHKQDDPQANSNDSKAWTKPMLPAHLQGLGFIPLQIQHRGTDIDGEVYNLDDTLECEADARAKRLKAIYEESKDYVFVN